MRLDVSIFRYMSKDDFRVLTAIEMGSKNHQLVPVQLIETIAQLKRGGCRRVLSNLLKNKLIAHDSKKYDGYKLTYNGYDFLALRALISRGHLGDVGIRIGVGKEADIHVAFSPDGKKLALKLHRLGRVSFKSIKNNRDYLQHRKHASWMYMARLAATKEYAYNKALADAGFRVPHAIDHNRHAILMEFVDATPMYNIRYLKHPLHVMERLFKLIVRLGKAGLIHGDFNEFNLMINEKEEITLIDFPQIVMMDHVNADYYFMRDVNCIKAFFRKRFSIECEEWPTYKQVMAEKNKSSTEDKSADSTGNSSGVTNIGALVERRDDDLLLQAIQEERECDLEDEESENEDQTEECSDEDDEDAEGLAGEMESGLKIESDSEENDEEDMNALINKMMERRRMEEGEMEELEREMDELEEDEDSENEETAAGSNKKDSKTTAETHDSDDEITSPLQQIKNRVANEMLNNSPDTHNGRSDSESEDQDAEDGDYCHKGENEAQVPTIENQIHVLRRKKREKLTPAEIREKMKNKVKQQNIRSAGKNKGQKKMKQEFKSTCQDFGL